MSAQQINRQMSTIVAIVVFASTAMALFDVWKPVVLGFALGCVAGLCNTQLLLRRLAISHASSFPRSLGFLPRLAVCGLAVWLAFAFPLWLDWRSVGGGYIAYHVCFGVVGWKNGRLRREGEHTHA